MVLKEPPLLPKRWLFKEKTAEKSFRQTTITSFSNVSSLKKSEAQILPDHEREWIPPRDLSLCRKGFLVPTDLIENREIVRRSLYDLTYNYTESNFERQRKKRLASWNKSGAPIAESGSNKPPLQCFCSFFSKDPQQLLLQTSENANQISETSDWQPTAEKSSTNEKLQRAKDSKYLLLPKFYLLEQLKKRGGVTFHDHNTVGCEMSESLQFNPHRKLVETDRRPQKSATDFAIHHLQKTGGAVLVLPVGCGKTVCAIYIAMYFRVCTLIVVGTENLIGQWKERIQEYAPGARVGMIQGTVCETENCDFVIACTVSLSQKIYNPADLRRIGMVIFDEAHHAAAPTFLTAVWQVAAPYMLALTQDPTRQDGMTNILYHFFSYNVFLVHPSLPPGIELHVGVHRFHKRCFIQDSDCISATKLKERRHNASHNPSSLEYCEALASYDKKHYSDACLSSAPVALLASRSNATLPTGVSGLPETVAYHAQSSWQNGYSDTDIPNLTFTQVYQSLQSDAHRNAVIVAYIKQFLKTNNANSIHAPTLEECNATADQVFEKHRSHVNVRIAPVNTTQNASTSLGRLKMLHECTRDELQTMQQVERQVLVLTSEKEHIDSLYDRMVRSGIPTEMIAVYVGGTNKKLTTEERNELLARRIILATYAMAAEGTDIATLNTIIFATPRSSITDQAIGRGLRDKLTPEIMPYVVDLCDEWCQMTKTMYYARNKSYQFYQAKHHYFDDLNSYNAVGSVCWKKPTRSRTQRIADARKRQREETKQLNAAKKLAKKKPIIAVENHDDSDEETVEDSDIVLKKRKRSETDDDEQDESDDEATEIDDGSETIDAEL